MIPRHVDDEAGYAVGVNEGRISVEGTLRDREPPEDWRFIRKILWMSGYRRGLQERARRAGVDSGVGHGC